MDLRLVMGAGACVALHGKFQVVTENTLFALPETALGFSHDLCASRLPGFFGEYLGLTGARLNGAEMLACGLVTHFVPSAKLSSLEEALEEINTTDPFVISSTISKLSEWEPWRIELITKEMVDWYFKKVEDDDWYDLNLTAHAIAKL